MQPNSWKPIIVNGFQLNGGLYQPNREGRQTNSGKWFPAEGPVLTHMEVAGG